MPRMPVDAMAVGVFGHLDADERIWARDEDCYIVFHALSSAMGHLSPATPDDPTRGLWAMNDAGGPWLGSDPRGRRGQFQVQPESNAVVALPIEPFTVAATASVDRFGPLTLDGLEYYLPLNLAGPAARHIEEGRSWFALADVGARTTLGITLDSGESSVIVDRRSDLVEALADVGPPGEDLDPALLDDGETVDFADPVPWRWWLGEGPPHTVTLSATTTEWTPLAIGRVVALVSESCRRVGITDHIGVRVVRAGQGRAAPTGPTSPGGARSTAGDRNVTRHGS